MWFWLLLDNSKKVVGKIHEKMNNYKLEPWCNKQMVEHAFKRHHVYVGANPKSRNRRQKWWLPLEHGMFDIMISYHKKR